MFNLFKRKPKPAPVTKQIDPDWIRANGSKELKLLLEKYPDSNSLYDSYINERINKERPGWVLYKDHHALCLEEIDITDYVNIHNVGKITLELEKYPQSKFYSQHCGTYIYGRLMIQDFCGEKIYLSRYNLSCDV